ncbi:hypothetical protein TNCV_3186571 [Trichonephila clavipes]|nr:hypothetical protein TNCV_3186571 [Trichonephila clavipes]
MEQLSCWKTNGPSRNISIEMGVQHCPECPIHLRVHVSNHWNEPTQAKPRETPHTIMLPLRNLTVGTMQSLKKRSPGIRQTQTNGAVILLEDKWAFPKYCHRDGSATLSRMSNTSQSSCFQSLERTDSGQTTRNTPTPLCFHYET